MFPFSWPAFCNSAPGMNDMLLHVSRLGLAILIARVLTFASILALEGLP